MNYSYHSNEALIKLLVNEASIKKNYFKKSEDHKNYAIAWNLGQTQSVRVDDAIYEFKQNTVLPIMLDQSYEFESADDFIVWQFNTEFYCIANHDKEVGCIGFLFYGLEPVIFVDIHASEHEEMLRLKETFIEEFVSDEAIKAEMLRMLLVRLIIKITRLAKKQILSTEPEDEKFDLLRQYNMLVDVYFIKEKQVPFYAQKLNRSPKTIANIFALYSKKTPLQIIHERIIIEAKRLFYYTDKSVKEIAFELGFEDAANFSKFFKKHTSQSPSELRKLMELQ